MRDVMLLPLGEGIELKILESIKRFFKKLLLPWGYPKGPEL